jgi:hypothetical protein
VNILKMIYRSGVIAALSSNPKTFTGHAKNVNTSLEKVPSTVAKKRFSARLRKIRWSIYKNIRSKKRKVTTIIRTCREVSGSFLQAEATGNLDLEGKGG